MADTTLQSEIAVQAPHDDAARLQSLATDVGTALEHPAWSLRFPRALEFYFEDETGAARARHLVIAGLIGLPMYEVLTIADFTLAPDVFREALILRFGVVTPCALAVIVALLIGMRPAVREFVEAAILFLLTGSLIFVASISHLPNVPYLYFPGVMLTITFSNITVPLRFWHALAFSLAIVLAYAASVMTLRTSSAIVLGMFVLANVVFTLYANYLLEHDMRLRYLLDLRERIRIARLDLDNSELDRLSRLDPLTGISNRRDLDAALGKLLEAPRRPVALAVFDIDNFKGFNDAYGHPEGDACLRMVAEKIRTSLRRSGDVCARIGGDEFVAVLRDTDVSTALVAAERVRAAIQAARVLEPVTGKRHQVTVSVGIATADHPTSAADLLSEADNALYRAKQLGRNRVSA